MPQLQYSVDLLCFYCYISVMLMTVNALRTRKYLSHLSLRPVMISDGRRSINVNMREWKDGKIV